MFNYYRLYINTHNVSQLVDEHTEWHFHLIHGNWEPLQGILIIGETLFIDNVCETRSVMCSPRAPTSSADTSLLYHTLLEIFKCKKLILTHITNIFGGGNIIFKSVSELPKSAQRLGVFFPDIFSSLSLLIYKHMHCILYLQNEIQPLWQCEICYLGATKLLHECTCIHVRCIKYSTSWFHTQSFISEEAEQAAKSKLSLKQTGWDIWSLWRLFFSLWVFLTVCQITLSTQLGVF